MHNDILQLSEMMEEETGIFRDMIHALEVEKAAAIQADLDALVDSRMEKEACVDRLKATADRKARVVGRLAHALQLPTGVHAFEAILDFTENESTGPLRRLRDRITSLARVVDAKNRENATVLEQGLKITRGALALVENIGNPQTVYAKTGQVGPGRPVGRLLSRNY